MSEAGTTALNSVGDTNVVVLLTLFQRTIEAPVKFEPRTVSVKPGSPAVAELGLMLLMTGPPCTAPAAEASIKSNNKVV
jgi:hypothetical protein